LEANLIVRELRFGDIDAIAPNLRDADRLEVEACTALDMHEALSSCARSSALVWAIDIDGVPAGVFGAVPFSLLGGVGCPWLLGTPALERAPSSLTRQGRRYIRRMLSVFPGLTNYVDARNEKSIRWLRALGFNFDATPVPYGLYGLPFYRFQIGK
jgi:hypothetical protein